MGPTDHIEDEWLRALYDNVYLTPAQVYRDARAGIDSGSAADRLATMRIAAKAVDAILADIATHGEAGAKLYDPPEKGFWFAAQSWLDVRIESELAAGRSDAVWAAYDSDIATGDDAAVDDLLREMDDDNTRVHALLARLNDLIVDSHGFHDALIDARSLSIITTPVTEAIARAANNSIRMAAMAGRMADGAAIVRELLPYERQPQLDPALIEILAGNALVPVLVERDRESINGILGLLPETIENGTLAYNLACTWAVLDDRERLFPAIARARALGRTRDQFLFDPDFEAFGNDAEFLASLE
jgi:hypothetical protein